MKNIKDKLRLNLNINEELKLDEEALWNNIESALPKKKPKRRILLWLFSLVIVGSISVAIMELYNTDNDIFIAENIENSQLSKFQNNVTVNENIGPRDANNDFEEIAANDIVKTENGSDEPISRGMISKETISKGTNSKGTNSKGTISKVSRSAVKKSKLTRPIEFDLAQTINITDNDKRKNASTSFALDNSPNIIDELRSASTSLDQSTIRQINSDNIIKLSMAKLQTIRSIPILSINSLDKKSEFPNLSIPSIAHRHDDPQRKFHLNIDLSLLAYKKEMSQVGSEFLQDLNERSNSESALEGYDLSFTLGKQIGKFNSVVMVGFNYIRLIEKMSNEWVFKNELRGLTAQRIETIQANAQYFNQYTFINSAIGLQHRLYRSEKLSVSLQGDILFNISRSQNGNYFDLSNNAILNKESSFVLKNDFLNVVGFKTQLQIAYALSTRSKLNVSLQYATSQHRLTGIYNYSEIFQVLGLGLGINKTF